MQIPTKRIAINFSGGYVPGLNAVTTGAVRAIQNDQSGVMVVFQPPDLKSVPLAKAINKIRTVPAESQFVQIARSIGIYLGD